MKEDSLSAASVTHNLETRFIGQRVIYYPSVTSTNEAAKRKARQGAEEGTVIIADEQTAGKGRKKRVWLSPGGNIALSVILRPDIAHLPSLIMLASLAVARGIESTTGLKPQVKWPNDVLINGKKVCGILIENEVCRNTVNYAVIGIGINVSLRRADFPEIELTATSLSDETERGVSRLSVVRNLLVEMERLYLALRAGGSIYEEWRDSLVTLGKKISVTSGTTRYEGIAESVAENGSLRLRHADGSLTTIVAGDATLQD